MTQPTWLQRHLTATGRANPDRISRTVRLGLCPHCHAHIASGLDADRCGLPVHVDVHPISTLGETLAALTQRPTYDLTGNLRQPSLDPRRPTHIRRPRRYPVLTEHRCHQPLPAEPAVTTPAPTHLEEPDF